MTQPDLLTWREAASRRDSGMTRAVEHADAVASNWSDAALSLVIEYAAVRFTPFLAEEAREFCTTLNGLPDPPDGRAWGAVLQRAARTGHIVKIGYAPAKSSNLSPKVLWERASRSLATGAGQ